MNIAVFTKKTTLHKDYGGMETQNEILLKGLQKKGHEITVFSPNWELSSQEQTKDGIKFVLVDCVYRMGPVFGFFGTYQKNNWINKSYLAFKEKHNKNKFDIVLAQSSTGLGVIKRKEELGIKVVSIAHGTIIGEYQTFVASMNFPKDIVSFVQNTGFTLKNFFRRQRDFVHGSERIIAVSNYVKTALIDQTFVPDNKITVINNGIDHSKFVSAKKIESRGNKLLYVGQIIQSKGLKDLYEMFLTAEFSGLNIDIVGGGDYFETLKNLVEKSDLGNRFNLVGKVSYNEVVNNYFLNPEYGAFLLPTKRHEGFPMVLVETMFAGLPTVAYNIGGVGDAVIDGKTGYLIKPKDHKEFIKKTLELISSKKLNLSMSKKSIEYANKNLTLDAMVNKYEKVLQEVLA